jgi:cobalamin biosynthesis protein CobT
VCDEADTGAAPPPELDRVLDLLRASIKVASGC